MAFPTLSELYEEVDREFFEANPDAPRRLDPNDPSQSGLVDDWNKRFDDKVNKWTDAIFKALRPWVAVPLDPTDPGDESDIKLWLEIQEKIRAEGPAPYDGTTATTQAPAGRLVSVRQIEWGGYALTFDGPIEADDVNRLLFPDGAPSGPQLTANSSTEYQLAGMTWEALEAMPHEIASMISEAGILTAE